MSSFLGSSVPSLNLITTYHGPLDFVDNQNTFYSVFGTKPPLLHINRHSTISAGEPIEDPNLVPRILTEFFNRCKYDIFTCICRDDYVGFGYIPDNSQAIQEICKKINALSMHYTLGTITKTCHPNDLYMKYLTLASSLPKNSTSWNIVLCTTYYNSLSESLQNKMREEQFTMPLLHTLTDKPSQLAALRTVKDAAAIAYKNMINEENRIQSLLNKQTRSTTNTISTANVHFALPNPSNTPHHTHHPNHLHNTLPPSNQPSHSLCNDPIPQQPTFPHPSPTPFNNTKHHTQPLIAYQSNSQAEATLQQYSRTPPPSQSTSSSVSLQQSSHITRQRQPPPTITRNNQQYPYDPLNPSTISDFPISFRGCLGCGNTDHSDFKTCPFRSIPGMPTQFWKNLWLHKPHTKKKSDPIPNTPRPFPIPYSPQQPILNPPHTPSSTNQQLTQHNPLPPSTNTHGLGRGSAATQPAWMTRTNTNNSSPTTPSQQLSNSFGSSTTSNTTDNTSPSKRSRLFLMTAQIFQTSPNTLLKPMPLDIDNGLPAVAMSFGSPDTPLQKQISFTCHIDSCAAMNTGNMLVHQWIITNYPDIVANYVCYNDKSPFQPIQLLCALKETSISHQHTQAEIDAANSLTAVVRYKTPYTLTSTNKPCFLSFGLGDNVTVNSIIGLPQLKLWHATLSFATNTLLAENISYQFPLEYSTANSGLPSGIQFNSSQFVRPTSSSSSNSHFQHTSTSSERIPLPLSTPSVTESTNDGVTQRSVSWPANTESANE